MKAVKRVDVLGIPFHALTPAEAVEEAVALLAKPGTQRVVTPNPEIVWNCTGNETLRTALQTADLILADGVGILKAAQSLGRPLPERVMGVEWAEAMLPRLAQLGKRLYLLGGKLGVAETAAKRLCERFPTLIVCGWHDGYFSGDAPVLDAIRDAKADVIYVCLGTPRQELWCYQNAPLLDHGLLAALGGTIDVFAGNVKRAPRIWSRLGLEWLYRVLRQPSRLPRLLAVPRFLRAVKQQKQQETQNTRKKP